jgi:hypothetical protein
LRATRGGKHQQRSDHDKYVCHPTYYEGRHTDLQVIF